MTGIYFYCRCDDILSCISALDEVIAEFDEPSLPYINDDEDYQHVILPTSSESSISQKDPHYQVELVSRNLEGGPPVQASGLAQLHGRNSSSSIVPSHPRSPSRTSEPSSSFDAIFSTKFVSSHTSSTSFSEKAAPKRDTENAIAKNSNSRKTQASSSSGSSANNFASPSNSKPSSLLDSGGTYSKGTNYEFRIPQIPSDILTEDPEPIYSTIGKPHRPQLSSGVFTSAESGRLGLSEACAPAEPEVDYEMSPNNNNGSHTADSDSIGSPNSGSLGKMSVPVVSGGSKEQWNFPSDKNLPRSLRKTRKTCLLEDESEKTRGKMQEDSDLISGESIYVADRSAASSCSGSDSMRSDSAKNTKTDKHKLYAEMLPAPRNNAKSNHHHHHPNHTEANKSHDDHSQHSYSSSSSLSFNSSSDPAVSGVAIAPKPRMRQQIPSPNQREQSSPPNKYPPSGKVPKPNPKPGVNANRADLSSPLSLQVEMSPVEDEMRGGSGEKLQGEVVQPSKRKKININKSFLNGAHLHEGDEQEGSDKLKNNVNNGQQGQIMRVMMMMKPSAKANSTGSASSISISRSSSSSSGGDPNYYSRKDTFSSSSGVVVTTNSSSTASTASPTNSSSFNNNNNNNDNEKSNNNNVTIMSATRPLGKVVAGDAEVSNKAAVSRRVTCQQQQDVKSSSRGKAGPREGGAVIGANPAGPVGVLEVDDGYLSMINRNEAPLLWPEEFIENETFSPAELKRLSVHLPTDYSDDSCSEEGRKEEIELEIVDYEREPSRRTPQHHHHSNQDHPHSHSSSGKNRNKSSSSAINRTHSRDTNTTSSSGGRDKMDYFSDDSLEGESEESYHQDLRGSGASPYRTECPDGSFGRKRTSSRLSPPNNSQLCHQNVIVVNHAGALVNQQPAIQSRSQISRIPKMVQGTSHNNHSPVKGSSRSARSSPAKDSSPPMRKPCSFFISLNDGSAEVIEVGVGKSSSLPKGSKVAISPVKRNNVNNKDLSKISPDSGSPKLSRVDLCGADKDRPDDRTNTPNVSSNITISSLSPSKSNHHALVSNLPQLRHTKSINTGVPRLRANNISADTAAANANKRKSTSDLVMVVGASNIGHQKDPNEQTKEQGVLNTFGGESEHAIRDSNSKQSPVVTVSNFSRTATFLVPCSRNTEGKGKKVAELEVEVVVADDRMKSEGQKDDETDNDEDDLSSDFDLISSAEPDSLQPLSMDDVHDFVSEIMDTAIRHGLTKGTTTNYPSSKAVDPSGNVTNSLQLATDTDDKKPEEVFKDGDCTQESNNNSPINSSNARISSHIVNGSSGYNSVNASGYNDVSQIALPEDSSSTSSPKNLKVDTSVEIMDKVEKAKDKVSSDNCNKTTLVVVGEKIVCEDYSGESVVGVERTQDGHDKLTVAEQLEAVVTTFLSDNESFLKKEEEDEEELEGDNERASSKEIPSKDSEKEEVGESGEQVESQADNHPMGLMVREAVNFGACIKTDVAKTVSKLKVQKQSCCKSLGIVC
jgi:hypothetical protein